MLGGDELMSTYLVKGKRKILAIASTIKLVCLVVERMTLPIAPDAVAAGVLQFVPVDVTPVAFTLDGVGELAVFEGRGGGAEEQQEEGGEESRSEGPHGDCQCGSLVTE